MGLPRAKRLVDAGRKMHTTFHKRRGPADELKAMGAETVPTPRDVAKATDVIITVLPADPELKETVFGSTGILEG